MVRSIRRSALSPGANRDTLEDISEEVSDPSAVNTAVQAAIAGSADGGARGHNTRAAARGALAASIALGAVARSVRMRITDEAGLFEETEIDCAVAAPPPWQECRFAAVSTDREAGAAAAEAGQPKRTGAGPVVGALNVGTLVVGTTAPIVPVYAAAGVRRDGASRGAAALRIVGWGLYLAAVVVFASTLWILVTGIEQAAEDLPKAHGPRPCKGGLHSCRKSSGSPPSFAT